MDELINTCDASAVVDMLTKKELLLADAEAFASELSDQNHRFHRVREIFGDEPEIQAIAIEGIAEEQYSTFINLVDMSSEITGAMAKWGETGLAVENALYVSKQEFEETEDRVSQKEELVEQRRQELSIQEEEKARDILAQIESLSPQSLPRVEALLNERVGGLARNKGIDDLETEIITILEESDKISDRIEYLERQEKRLAELEGSISTSWPLPLVLMHKGESLSDIQTQTITLDELPVQPRLNTAEHSSLSELREQHIDQPEASIYAAFYLESREQQIVTVDELVDFLYGKDLAGKFTEAELRSRVTTILGPVVGDRVKRILDTDGMILQYGWRRMLEHKDGRVRVANTRRIYRALSIADLDVIDLEESGSDESHSYHFVATQELEDAKEEAARDKQKALAGSTIGPVAIVTSDPQNETVKALDLLAEQEIPVPLAQTIGAATVNEAKKEDESLTWERSFKTEVGTIIQELEECGLLKPDHEFTAKQARVMMRQSTIFGTKTAMKRMQQRGLTNRFKNLPQNGYGEVVLLPRDMIIMRLLNTHRDTLGNKGSRQQEEAVRIIESALKSYFKKHDALHARSTS